MRKTHRAVVAACLLTAACSQDATDREAFQDDTNAAGQSDAGGAANGSTTGSGASTTAGNNPGNKCEEHVVRSTNAAPDMLVVLDRSGSMNPNNNDDNADRWGGSRDAVIQVTGDFDDRVRFGLMTFPAFVAGGGGGGFGMGAQCTPGTVNVPIGLSQGAAISDALSAMNASGRTPTAPTLEDALSVIGASAAAAPDSLEPLKYVLLVTDGDPNCSDQNTGAIGEPDPVARQQTIDAIKTLTDAGVKTYVVGYQTAGTDFASQLDLMAAAGGTGETMHRSVESGADLTATFTQIADGVVSCSYKLDTAVKDPSYVLVTVGTTARKLNNSADGWTLASDNQTVTLTGAACDEVKAGAVFSVVVQCTVVQIQ